MNSIEHIAYYENDVGLLCSFFGSYPWLKKKTMTCLPCCCPMIAPLLELRGLLDLAMLSTTMGSVVAAFFAEH